MKGASIYSPDSELSLKSHIMFELKSRVGRMFLPTRPKFFGAKHLLHICAGHNYIKGWTNVNFFSFAWIINKKRKEADWMLDLRYPLKCADNVWDGVFSEHTIEHLSPYDAKGFLKELHRTMKDGAGIRIVVPDLEKYIQYYNGDMPDKEFERRPSAAEWMRNLTQNWWHRSLWDFDLMRKLLEEIGFKNVKKVSLWTWEHKELIKDMKARERESLYVEASK